MLSFVENGDLLSAIDLARTYYTDEAPGNRNGLPDDPELRKETIGQKMQDLMQASARYAFSEERLTDATHITPDNRGVDRTDLFEGLVRTCARACIALDDFDFLRLIWIRDQSSGSGMLRLGVGNVVRGTTDGEVGPWECEEGHCLNRHLPLWSN